MNVKSEMTTRWKSELGQKAREWTTVDANRLRREWLIWMIGENKGFKLRVKLERG